MSKSKAKRKRKTELTAEERAAQQGKPLPDRRAMAIADIGGPAAGVITPIPDPLGDEHTLPVEPPAET